MKKLNWICTIAILAIGCTQAPVTRPRILSVQTPAGMPAAPSLSTTRNNPLSVPTAPVGSARPTAIVAPAPAAVVVQPPPGAVAPGQVIPVPAAPGAGVQGVAPPNTINQKPKYYPPNRLPDVEPNDK